MHDSDARSDGLRQCENRALHPLQMAIGTARIERALASAGNYALAFWWHQAARACALRLALVVAAIMKGSDAMHVCMRV